MRRSIRRWRSSPAISHEITGILYDAQTELDAVIGTEEWESVDEPSRQIWNYLDLEIFRDAATAGSGEP